MICDVYCDESRQDLIVNSQAIGVNNRFCCIGGLMLPITKRASIKDDICELQKKHSVYGEIRWGAVSSNKLAFYTDLIDLFFSEDELIFRTVVVDSTKVNNHEYNQADHELGYYKFYYQLLYRWLNPIHTYRIFTDQKTNRDRHRLSELRRIINRSFSNSNVVISAQSIDSRESLILQTENIIMGAVGYKFNWSNNGLSQSKMAIVKRIEYHLGCPISSTCRNERKFNVFAIELREGN